MPSGKKFVVLKYKEFSARYAAVKAKRQERKRRSMSMGHIKPIAPNFDSDSNGGESDGEEGLPDEAGFWGCTG